MNSLSGTIRITALVYTFFLTGVLLNLARISGTIVTPVVMVLVGILSFLLTYSLTWKSIAATSGVVVLLFLCQVTGVNTGFPFGDFVFTNGVGPKVLDVPLVMPFAWLSILIPAWVSAGRILRYRTAVVAAIVVTAADAVIEFAADSLDLWHWQEGIPMELNYISWFGFSYVAFSIMEKYATEKEPQPVVPHLLFGQLLYFALTDVGLRFLVH